MAAESPACMIFWPIWKGSRILELKDGPTANEGVRMMKTAKVILIILFLSVSVNGYTVTQEVRDALIALYESTDGDNWSNNSGWKTPPLDSDGFAMPGTECGCYGVSCIGSSVAGLALVC